MEKFINKYLFLDCLQLLKRLPEKSIDCIITDPPYYKIMKEEWDNQWENIAEYQNWVEQIAIEFKRVLKDNGSLYWFGDDKMIAYSQVIFDKYFNLLNNLVLQKSSSIATKGWARNRSYTVITERCLFYEHNKRIMSGLELLHNSAGFFNPLKNYFKKERQKIIDELNLKNIAGFNRWFIKTFNSQMCIHYHDDSQWELPTPEAYNTMQKSGFYKVEYEKLRRIYEKLLKRYQKFIFNGDKLRRTWDAVEEAKEVIVFNPIFKNRIHITQKPENLIKFLLQRSTEKGDVVLDCFGGSGTTGVACYKLQRNYILCDNNKENLIKGLKRIKEETKQKILL